MAKRTKKSQSEIAAEIKEKAEKAEARAKTAKKADTVKPPKGAKKAAEQQASTAQPSSGRNSEDKALFLHHLTIVTNAIAAKDKAVNDLRRFYKTAKSDGFLQDDFKDAFALQAQDGEKKRKSAIGRTLQIAGWLGYDLGAQLDLFLQDERVPAEDRAYSEGETASMQGKSANPDYHPSTPQHRAYMKGYHDHQAKLGGQFKKLDEATGYPSGDGVPKQPSNVVAMSREELKKQQAETHQAH